ncbi:MAG: TAXI family TRAP transporter solute-binding subunit [Planktomarina sp.]|nr:TAXI family TRAP transporter solute-binding subunit [Planktomarina sp.]|tara:strand:+ start:344 stop:1399 length:1056 start_codon:yes stop_codon:yes gene_type:complete
MLKRTKLAGLATSAVLMTSMAFGQVNLTSHTAGAGTAVAITATALVEYAADRGIANIQLKDGQTGTKYVKGLAEGKIDIITAPFILPFVLGKAVGPYSKMDKAEAAELAKNIQLLYPYTLSIFSLYAYDSKGIDGWNGLKGRKVLNGPPRGTATLNSRSLVQLFSGLKSDEDYESVTVSWGQMPAAIIDGSADAVVVPAMFPGPRVTRASAAGAMTMWSMPKEAFESEAVQKFLHKPGSNPYVVPVSEIREAMGPGWTIVSEDDMFRGKAVPGGDMVQTSMDEELAYQLTKAHIENLDTHKKLAPFMGTLNFGVLDRKVAGLCGPNPIKFHPGAVRAWEEAGHSVPDCAKP